MITLNGYIKENQLAEGIAITWGKDLIAEKGGLLSFIRYFEFSMHDEESRWIQRCKNRPQLDVNYVYIIVHNQVRYRLYYAGWETGETEIHNGDGHSWSKSAIISWPRIVACGPFVKAPYKIIKPGFQGFRYTTKLF